MLEVTNIKKTYRKSGMFSQNMVPVIRDVSFSMKRGECLGIIGESGSGKSTLARLIMGIEKPDSGKVLFKSKNVLDAHVRRGNISAVFQDYTSSLNPNYTVYDAVTEPFTAGFPGKKRLNAESLKQKAGDLLRQVELNEMFLSKHPHELSGGEAQRVCVARAISTTPELVILDEAVSSLDMLIQVQILDLFIKLKNEMNMSYIFITHDIEAAVYICDRILFFYQGRFLESADICGLKGVREAYSKKLLDSAMYNLNSYKTP